RKRIILTYGLLIALLGALVGATLIFTLKTFYLNNITAMVRVQAEQDSSFFQNYQANQPNVLSHLGNLATQFGTETKARVQIFNDQGQLIGDSNNVILTPISTLPIDIQRSLQSQKETVTQMTFPNGEPVLSISMPLFSNHHLIGVLRFVTSLLPMNETISTISIGVVLFIVLAMAITLAVSLLLARTVVLPLRKMSEKANKLASGYRDVFFDATTKDEVGQLANAFNVALQELNRLDQIKKEFIHSISHELRTPLTSIKGFVVTLGYTNKDEEQIWRDGLRIIEQETDRLSNLVDELLDFNRLEAGQWVIRFNRVNLSEMVWNCVDLMQPRAERQIMKIKLHSDKDVWVEGDYDRLKQVILNLLDNSLKFSNSGSEISVAVLSEEEYGVVTVGDNGPGIPHDILPHVTEPFYRGTNAAAGSGLGLSICNQIVEHHNGTFDISSELEKGTTVTIRLIQAC
ncbi:MAG: histidine kinase, partial [Bacilli bacterium]|nr:histidine kinase [Bacilli bacterium]